MKMLLTSAGIKNENLVKALREMVNDQETRVAFIPTAANTEDEDKGWLIDNFEECRKMGRIDIVDIASLSKDQWLPRLEKANVIFVGGGNTIYLMEQIVKSGLQEELPRLLKDRVYVGISAGSIVLSKTLMPISSTLYEEDGSKKLDGLGYVNFHVFPHLNAPYFEKVTEENIKSNLHQFDSTVYAIDDETAIQITGDSMKTVGTGKCIKFDV